MKTTFDGDILIQFLEIVRINKHVAHCHVQFLRWSPSYMASYMVSSVSEARNLGVWFYSRFQFQTHINKTCQSAFYSIYNIRRIRKFLSFEAAKTLVQALVISHLDYCNSVLYGIPAMHTNKLQRVQNAAARLLTNKPRYSHITPVMVDLRGLPVRFRIIFKVILLTFKAVYGTAPTYITNLLSFNNPGIILGLMKEMYFK